MSFPCVQSFNPNIALAEATPYAGPERRRKPRINERFPVKVKGMNLSGNAFEVEAVLDNLSVCGLYFRTSQRVAPGAQLCIVIKLAVGHVKDLKVRRVAVRGLVRRSEQQPDNRIGLAVLLTHHKFI